MNDSKVKSSGYFDVGTKYSLTKDMLVNTSKKNFHSTTTNQAYGSYINLTSTVGPKLLGHIN